MGSVLLYCTFCSTGYASIGEIPTRCPACDKITKWVTAGMLDRPKVQWELSYQDRQFLHGLRIQD
jgi:hypothetical protein